ncbi:FkbM family methyltransferase [Ilyomonas limi]|uniref:FkbM family methyltransferase n=1 Tax=Ilyomonas limi TaxID=2575867 RepID=A0A4U3L6J4_9BACT|nr:FkbM family methyltransferase [Ilyomonas limi]TKK70855.1 FkbM family methyltransferase [Ilyomonas limi]
MSTIKKIIKNYGLNGLIVYLKLKTGSTKNIQVAGLKNEIALRNTRADKLLFKQIFVHEEYNFNTPVQPQFIIDAGANIGLSALYFANRFPGAVIVAVEVEKENFEMLSRNTKNYPNIKPINAGLWPKPAVLEVVDSGSGSTGFMVKETSADNPNSFKAISITDIIRMYQISIIDIVKIDIEGAEKELFSDNIEWIAKSKIIILELHDRKKEGCSLSFFTAFSQFNFECHPFEQNFLLINRDLVKS